MDTKESFTKLIGEGLIKGLDIYDMTQSHFYQSREVKFKQFILISLWYRYVS